jgi:hypothetical protein
MVACCLIGIVSKSEVEDVCEGGKKKKKTGYDTSYMLLAISRSPTDALASSAGPDNAALLPSGPPFLGLERPQRTRTSLPAIWTRTLQRLAASSAIDRLAKLTNAHFDVGTTTTDLIFGDSIPIELKKCRIIDSFVASEGNEDRNNDTMLSSSGGVRPVVCA